MERRAAPREDRDLQPPRHAGEGIAWPDWRGSTVAILASGPSIKNADLAALRGCAKVLAIKQNIDLFPAADAVYGCDAAWWRYRQGLPDFHRLKLTFAGNGLTEFPDVRRVDIRKRGRVFVDDILTDQVGVIGGGGNSGFQALNLAVQFGARRILLVGFDMNGQSGLHWYGRNGWAQANNPSDSNFRRWVDTFDVAAAQLAKLGVEVINAAPTTALRCFPKRSIEDTLRDWSA